MFPFLSCKPNDAQLTASISTTPDPPSVDFDVKGGADYLVPNGTGLSYIRKNIGGGSLFGTPTANWDFSDNVASPSGYSASGTDGISPTTFNVTSVYGGYTADTPPYDTWVVTVPAGTTPRTLQGNIASFFVANFSVTATLSDGSVPALTLDRNTDGVGTGSWGLYELTYAAASDGQTLTLTITAIGNNILLGWFWLSN